MTISGGTFDPSICEMEPIATPGAIQPHGALMTARADSGRVAHASVNLGEILGLPAASVLGAPIGEVIGRVNEILLREARRSGSETPETIGSFRRSDGQLLHLHAFQSGDYMCLDIEPVRDEDGRLPPGARQSVIETFSSAMTQVELCELAVHGLQLVLGYDRVMAYRFGADGHGEVIAERRRQDLEPYLGLHYPASDIPQIARALYLRQRVGAIADACYRPVPLLGHPELDDGKPLDLTHSSLRSVSPIHLDYMQNMHTAASLTIGLADGDRLWGMLVCHNTTPRIAGPEWRAAAGMIGQVVSLLLSRLGEVENAAETLARQSTLSTLVERLSTGDTLAAAFVAADQLILDLVGASAAVVRLAGQELHFGRTPPVDAMQKVLDSLGRPSPLEVLSLDDVTLRHPELPELLAAGSGILLLPLTSGDGDLIAWFRPEHVQTITWGGNPAEHGTWNPATQRMRPRASFDAWKETVTGRSLPWTSAERNCARELGEAIAAEMAQRTRAELARLRHYDPLTGLANRSYLQERLAQDGQSAAALLFIDLDRFKAVNDSMGHGVGDGLLIEVARSLVATVRPHDLVVRLGGDEFVVLCHRLDAAGIVSLAERLRQALEQPFEVAGRKCHISASIGIAMADSIGDLDLVRAADIAMYAAKKNGGNRGELFRPSLYEETTQLVELDNDMRGAIESEQFHLVYQPIFALNPETERLVGFEALLRWDHPLHGALQPGIFIPLAERLGHIHAMGNWVLRRAILQLQAFRSAGPELDLKMNVNVSPLQLARPDFLARLADLLAQVPDLPRHALCLEITETSLSDEAVSEALISIRALGVRIAIDDFGTGFSSLACLRRLPVDVAKLDRAFLGGGHTAAQDHRFFAAVTGLVHAADLKVVQEGIETLDQLALVRAAGADFAQGFHLAAPLSIAAALGLIAASRKE